MSTPAILDELDEIAAPVTTSRQMWECACETIRQWGHGVPFDQEPKMLNCDCCGKVTVHFFKRVRRPYNRTAA